MKIKILKDCSVEIITDVDNEDNPTIIDEDLKANEIIDGDIVTDKEDNVDFQFGDGTMIYGLSKKSYEVIKE